MPKRILPLTDRQVKTAKTAEKEYKLFDGEGLYLAVTPSGGKIWRMKYRLNGSERTMSIGPYPEFTLPDAREKRLEARKLIKRGIDPRCPNEEAAAEGLPFESLAREWHGEYLNTWSEVHAETIIARLEKDVFPYIGTRPVAQIDAPELLTVLRRIEKRGALDTAHRIRHHCGQIFRYGIATGAVTRNIAVDLQGALPPVKYGNYAAPVTPLELSPLLRAISDYQGSPIVRAALQLAPMVFLRPGELRHGEWSEIDFDNAQWNIPGPKMKMNLPHIVPLPSQAIDILKELQPITGKSRYIFPCGRSFHRPMSENAVNAALRRMGFEKGEITGHGFRATARTILDEVLGFRVDYIEHQLAHAVKDPNGRAYNRTSFIEERRRMMQAWADYLDSTK